MQQRSADVVFGAGSVRRGFLGQLFSESGYKVVIVDIDGPLIEALARQGATPFTWLACKSGEPCHRAGTGCQRLAG